MKIIISSPCGHLAGRTRLGVCRITIALFRSLANYRGETEVEGFLSCEDEGDWKRCGCGGGGGGGGDGRVIGEAGKEGGGGRGAERVREWGGGSGGFLRSGDGARVGKLFTDILVDSGLLLL